QHRRLLLLLFLPRPPPASPLFPYTTLFRSRLLREGINFFSELKPGGLKDDGPAVATQTALTTTQLEALRMVLAKEVAAERDAARSEEHTSELQSRGHLVCRLLLEKKKKAIR